MPSWPTRTAAAVISLSLLLAAGLGASAGHSRENAIVTAARTSISSIVHIKVEKRGAYTKREITGAGVIVDFRGYVLTNHHVISGAESIKAVLPDGTETAAEVVVEDAAHDMAVIKLPGGRTYSELRFGPSSDLMVGEEVIAIGHPFGYRNTVSTGIVSALDREAPMPEGETLTHLIQTTASINPGNSGGPLLNINGEMIGINMAVRQEAQGIAFALTADVAQQALSRLLSAGKMAHVAHGLTCHEVVRDEDGDDRVEVVVDDAAPDSPGAAAGLAKGDVLVKVAGAKVSNRFDVERALWDSKAGDAVEVAVRRGGQKKAVNLVLADSDGKEPTAQLPPPVVTWDVNGPVTPVKDQK
jgi:serine protease Do